MNQLVWIALGLAASLLTVGVAWGGRSQRISPEAGIVGSGFAIFAWGVFIINSFTVHTVTANGDVITQSYVSVGILGAAAGFFCLYVLIRAILEQADSEVL